MKSATLGATLIYEEKHMIKDNNKRITITLSKKQFEWLKKFTKKHNITISKYIVWLLSKKASELSIMLDLQKGKEEAIKDFDEYLLEIAKAKIWD